MFATELTIILKNQSKWFERDWKRNLFHAVKEKRLGDFEFSGRWRARGRNAFVEKSSCFLRSRYRRAQDSQITILFSIFVLFCFVVKRVTLFSNFFFFMRLN